MQHALQLIIYLCELLLCLFHSCEALIFAQLLIINYGKSSMQAFMRCGEILLHLLLFLTSSFRFFVDGRVGKLIATHNTLSCGLRFSQYLTTRTHTFFLFSWDKFEYIFGFHTQESLPDKSAQIVALRFACFSFVIYYYFLC